MNLETGRQIAMSVERIERCDQLLWTLDDQDARKSISIGNYRGSESFEPMDEAFAQAIRNIIRARVMVCRSDAERILSGIELPIPA